MIQKHKTFKEILIVWTVLTVPEWNVAVLRGWAWFVAGLDVLWVVEDPAALLPAEVHGHVHL